MGKPAHPSVIVTLQDAHVSLSGQPVLHSITWRLQAGERWGIFGGNGSGKSTFLRLVRGDLWPRHVDSPPRLYSYNGHAQAAPAGVRARMPMVSHEQQDRYHAMGWNPTLEEATASGLFDSIFVYQALTQEQRERAHWMMERFGIAHLAKRGLLEVSRGEARRALIARALMQEPLVLLLDECASGLDVESREILAGQLNQLQSTTLLYASHRHDELPIHLTHALWMHEGRIQSHGPHAARPAASIPTPKTPRMAEAIPRAVEKPFLVKIQNATVCLDGQPVLHEINWGMYADENWAVTGPNGCGKTTLLQLIHGEHWPALGGEIARFNQHEPMAREQLQRRIGYVSPHLQADYTYNETVYEAVLSGRFGSIGLFHHAKPEDEEAAQQWMRQFDLDPLRGCPIRELSYGQLRKVLFARALVNRPWLLLLDEPYDGLDAESRREMSRLIDGIGRAQARVIMVTHHAHDLPACITHVMQLRGGRIEGCWPVQSISAS